MAPSDWVNWDEFKISGCKETTGQKEQKVGAVTGPLRENSVKRASWRERWLLVQGCNQPALRDLVKRHLSKMNTLMSLLPASHLLVVAKDNWRAEGIGLHWQTPSKLICRVAYRPTEWMGKSGVDQEGQKEATWHTVCVWKYSAAVVPRVVSTNTHEGRGGGEGAWGGLLPWVVLAGGGAA